MPVPTVTARQVAQTPQHAHGHCATCPHPERPAPGHLAPGRYELRFFEFTHYAAARDAQKPHGSLRFGHYRRAAAGTVVHVFRRARGRTRLVATLHGGGALHHPEVVQPDEGPVEIYACLSHFPLPSARVAQFTSEDGLGALRRRCVRFSPADRHHVAAHGGGHVFDVVLTDWRRIAEELHAVEQQMLERLRRTVEGRDAHGGADEAVRQMLAELTLYTALADERTDPKVWDALNPAPKSARPGRRARPRLPGLSAKPYTAAEFYLLRRRERIAGVRHLAEVAAVKKYVWLEQSGYREMRWDALTDRNAQRATVCKEAALIAVAVETRAGRRYLQGYATDPGSWYGHYLWAMSAADAGDVRASLAVEDAYLTILTVIGATMLRAAEPDDEAEEMAHERHTRLREAVKNAAFGTTDVPFTPIQRASVHTSGLERNKRQYEKQEKKIEARVGDHERAEEVLTAARTRARDAHLRVRYLPIGVVMRKFIAASVRRAFGYAPRVVEENPIGRPSLMHEARDRARVQMRQEYERLQVQRLEATAKYSHGGKKARAAELKALEAELKTTRTKIHEVHGAYLEAANAESLLADGHAPKGGKLAALAKFSSKAQMAFMVLNLAVTLAELRGRRGRAAAKELVGSGADSLYATQYASSRTLAKLELLQAEHPEHFAGRAMRAKLLGARTWVGLARVCGTVAAALVIWDAVDDMSAHVERGESVSPTSVLTLAGGAILVTAAGADLAAMVFGEAALPVLTLPYVDILGFAILAGVGIYEFCKGSEHRDALREWLHECPWGTDKSAPDLSDFAQLRKLVQLIGTPEVTAKQIQIGRASVVRLTVRPSIFLPQRSSIRFDVSAGSDPVRSVEIGPLSDAIMDQLPSRPVRLPVRDLGNPKAAMTRVIARMSRGSLVFDMDYPLEFRLRTHYLPSVADQIQHHTRVSRMRHYSATPHPTPGRSFYDTHYFVDGSAHLELWPEEDNASWGRMELEPFALRPALIAGT